MNNVHLKLIEEKDAKDLFNLIQKNKKNLIRYFPLTVKSNNSIKSTIEYLQELTKKAKKKEMYSFGIYFHEILIGMVFIKSIDWRIPKCELGYFIDKSFEGKGIMSKIIDNTIKHCFDELKMTKIFLKIGTENIGSKRIAERKGFVLEGVLRKEFRLETNELVNVEYYGKIRT